MEIKFPHDYSSLPSFRNLVDLLCAASREADAARARVVSEMAADHLWLRLFVTLALEAREQSGPQVGLLCDKAQYRLNQAAAGLVMGDVSPVGVLREAGVLRAVEALQVAGCKLQVPSGPAGRVENLDGLQPATFNLQPATDLFCPEFARMNRHLAGDAVDPAARGNVRSRLAAGMKAIDRAAAEQALLLPESEYRGRDGNKIEGARLQDVVRFILYLERAICRSLRKMRGIEDCSAGMVSDAEWALRQFRNDNERVEFLPWLMELVERSPAAPRTVEDALGMFDVLLKRFRNR